MFDYDFHESLLALPDPMSRARMVLAHSTKTVVFTGAGISAESGISTFRDADTGALWNRFDPEVLSSMDGFMEDPELVWDWYKSVRLKALGSTPNAGHIAIASLGAPVITQNVDMLHEAAGSLNVMHMHGQSDKAKCTVCDWNGAYEQLRHQDVDLPACPKCGGLGRPDVVWFGEFLDHALMDRASEMIKGSVCIVVGTSGVVEPMCSFPKLADFVISINPRKEDHVHGALWLTGKAGEILPELVA
jgi:NAD-dependent deacetylase